MGDKSKIEWTEASWNPIVGCSKVSEGCRNCYAIRAANRMNGSVEAYRGLTVMKNGKPEWTGAVRFIEERLLQPLKWQRPRMIFVNSMSDLFHEDVSNDAIKKIFAVMAAAKQHKFQVLTKRPERMKTFLQSYRISQVRKYGDLSDNNGFDADSFITWPLPNIWLGVSVEDQKTADERIPMLLQTPAAIRWISAEPLLGSICLDSIVTGCGQRPLHCACSPDCGCGCPKLNWVVAGGESGPNARPSHPDWFRRLRDDCVSYNVPFFFKQWGEWQTFPNEVMTDKMIDRHITLWDDKTFARRVGKKNAGRLLDGEEWNEYPA